MVRATVVAGVVAPAVTTALLNVVGAVEDLLWIFEMRNASPELKSLFGYDFHRMISAWPLRTLREVIFAPVLGIVLGFLGALLFLATGFFIAGRRRNPTVRRYIWAGAAVGLIHSAIGLSLRGVGQLLELLPWNQRLAIEPLVGWIVVIGGFGLTHGRPLYAELTFLAAPVAGAVAGFLYARMLTVEGRTSASALDETPKDQP
jgi:hypothetical protein